MVTMRKTLGRRMVSNPRRITSALLILTLLLVRSELAAAKLEYDYEHQEAWRGSCNHHNNQRQSPINIPTLKTKCDRELAELVFIGWDAGHNGVFKNTGYNVQFLPDTPDEAKTYTHRGVYLLKQFHMHWGKRAQEGSEHHFDGHASELEIHFVHTKQDGKPTDEDYYTVVGVLADAVADLRIDGPWAQLDSAAVMASGSSVAVSQFHFEQFLPAVRDYYHYQGSLTTPPCNETVSWFVLKDKIKVPQEYLENLRHLQGAGGHAIEYNFRKLQDLGNRTVLVPEISPHSMLFETHE